MKFLIGLLAPYRSVLIGFAGVLFVAMMSGMVMGYMQLKAQDATIDRQATRITDLTEVNKGWQQHAAQQDKLRAAEQRNALLMQEKQTLIEERFAVVSEQLKQLEESNAEVRAYMAGKLPIELKRMLEAK